MESKALYIQALARMGRRLGKAYRILFAHEERFSLRRRIVREEEHVVWLATVLAKITKELRIYLISARSGVRDRVWLVVEECQATLRLVEHFEQMPGVYERPVYDRPFGQREADEIDLLSGRLAAMTEKALVCLREATEMIAPSDAFRTRRVVAEADITLTMCGARKRSLSYRELILDLCERIMHSLRRLVVGSASVPLVVVFDRYAHPEVPNPPKPTKPAVASKPAPEVIEHEQADR